MLFISGIIDLVQERFYKFYKFTNRDRLNGGPGAENKRFKIIGLKIAGIFSPRIFVALRWRERTTRKHRWRPALFSREICFL